MLRELLTHSSLCFEFVELTLLRLKAVHGRQEITGTRLKRRCRLSEKSSPLSCPVCRESVSLPPYPGSPRKVMKRESGESPEQSRCCKPHGPQATCRDTAEKGIHWSETASGKDSLRKRQVRRPARKKRMFWPLSRKSPSTQVLTPSRISCSRASRARIFLFPKVA